MNCHDLVTSLRSVGELAPFSSSRILDTMSHAFFAIGERAWRKE